MQTPPSPIPATQEIALDTGVDTVIAVRLHVRSIIVFAHPNMSNLLAADPDYHFVLRKLDWKWDKGREPFMSCFTKCIWRREGQEYSVGI